MEEFAGRTDSGKLVNIIGTRKEGYLAKIFVRVEIY